MADSFPFDSEKYVLLGKVTKAHGIKGELKLRPYSGESLSITRHKQVLLVSKEGTISPVFDVVKARKANKEVILCLRGVSDRNHSEKLSGMGVLVYKKDLPDLPGDEFYLHELEGLQVQTQTGKVIGKITAFFNNGAQDLLVVTSGKNEILVPLIPGMIVQRDASCLIIAPPPGLLDINSSEGGKGQTPP